MSFFKEKLELAFIFITILLLFSVFFGTFYSLRYLVDKISGALNPGQSQESGAHFRIDEAKKLVL